MGSTGVICGGGRAWGRRDDNRLKKAKRRVHITYVYNGTRYLVLRIIPGAAVCSNESTAQDDRHNTAPQGKGRRGAALLSYI